MPLIYCFYALLTIAFMVCAAAKPLRGRTPACKPKRSVACGQTIDRAKEKKSSADWHGYTINMCNNID